MTKKSHYRLLSIEKIKPILGADYVRVGEDREKYGKMLITLDTRIVVLDKENGTIFRTIIPSDNLDYEGLSLDEIVENDTSQEFSYTPKGVEEIIRGMSELDDLSKEEAFGVAIATIAGFISCDELALLIRDCVKSIDLR